MKSIDHVCHWVVLAQLVVPASPALTGLRGLFVNLIPAHDKYDKDLCITV
ncbi:MAG: hypothetical protein LM517_12175 [Nitrosomonas sp.]|nr:hypothetical protein [Nitrosomonas sp.]